MIFFISCAFFNLVLFYQVFPFVYVFAFFFCFFWDIYGLKYVFLPAINNPNDTLFSLSINSVNLFFKYFSILISKF